jgi:hypothetical protein
LDEMVAEATEAASRWGGSGDILQTLRRSRNLLALRELSSCTISVAATGAWDIASRILLQVLQVCRKTSAAATFIGPVKRLS